MSKKLFLFFLTILILSGKQSKAGSDSLHLFLPYAGISVQLPGGDMAQRFGTNGMLSIGVRYKTKNNLLFGVSYNYIFGSKIKNEAELFSNLKTAEGNIIDNTGSYGFLSVFESGAFTSFEIGKIFPLRKKQPNSGLYFSLSPGYLIHRIKIEVEDNNIPALNGDYRKGYDRLTGGPGIREQIGYFHLDKSNNITNYFVAFEMLQAWTHPKRKVNFDTMKPDAVQNRLDLLFGIKIGWMLPIRRSELKDYYIN